jgi:putative transposase
MTDAYHAGSALEAEAALLDLAKELDRTHPGAAASLREGLDETLTVLRLNVPPTLARTLRSTNCIESMISVCREHAGNVKRWRDGQMALRWCAAGMVEAGKQFRRVNGHLHLPTLRAALERESAEPIGTMGHDDQVSAARCSPGCHRSSTELGTSSETAPARQTRRSGSQLFSRLLGSARLTGLDEVHAEKVVKGLRP